MISNRGRAGFTIVELLIVVVVIAILAAITIVAYNGITNRAKESAVKADVATAARKLESLKLQDTAQNYPASLNAAGISASAGNTYYYQYSALDNTYCLQSSNGTIRWYAHSVSQTPMRGTCGGDSLVGHWNFNGNANDSSGSGLNGTVTGASLANGQSGASSSAYSFPGTGAYVTFGNSTRFNQPEITMSAWVRLAVTPSGSNTIMAKEGKYKYRIASTTALQVLSSTVGSWTHTPTCTYTSGFSANTWYHVAITLSSETGRIKGYVNGAQICDQPGPVITGYTANDLMVGSYNGSGAEGFNGSIDDARFYSRALGAAEVTALYDNGAQ